MKIIEIKYNDFDNPSPPRNDISSTIETVCLPINGMTCAACVKKVEQAVTKLDGVQRVSISLPLARATVVYDGKVVASDDIVKAIQATGYDACVRERTVEEDLEVLEHSKQMEQLRSSFSSASTTCVVVVGLEATRRTLPSRASKTHRPARRKNRPTNQWWCR